MRSSGSSSQANTENEESDPLMLKFLVVELSVTLIATNKKN